MKFVRKSSPGHEWLVVYRNSPHKSAEQIKEPPIDTLKFALHAMICKEIIS